jgi:hypothetical protein
LKYTSSTAQERAEEARLRIRYSLGLRMEGSSESCATLAA